MIRPVLRRAAVLFIASLGVASAVFGMVLWRHASLADFCMPGMRPDEPVTCYHRTVILSLRWKELAGLGIGDVLVCLGLAWLWSRLKHKAG